MIGPTEVSDFILLHRHRVGAWANLPRGELLSPDKSNSWKTQFMRSTGFDSVTVDRLTATQRTINGLYYTKEETGKGMASYFLISFPEHNASVITSGVLWLRRQNDVKGVIHTVRIQRLFALIP